MVASPRGSAWRMISACTLSLSLSLAPLPVLATDGPDDPGAEALDEDSAAGADDAPTNDLDEPEDPPEEAGDSPEQPGDTEPVADLPPPIATVDVEMKVVRGSKSVQLYEQMDRKRPGLSMSRGYGSNSKFHLLCTAPCSEPLQLRYTGLVVIGGHDGVPRSRPLDISEQPSPVKLRAYAGRKALQYVGAGLAATGLLFIVFGALPFGLNGSDQGKRNGAIFIGTGAGMFLIGGPLITFGSSRVRLGK